MMETNLSYANGRFEDLHPHHFLQLMTITEDIMLKREASKEANLGETATPYKYQGRDRGPHLPPGNASQWQRKELAKEITSNATVANAGDIGDLQVVVGDYQNSTKFFTQKNKCWCAPVREYAQSPCVNCGLPHYIDTPCKGGDSCVKMPVTERHSACPANMIKYMEEGTIKRLTHRFQGGTGGLPNAKTGPEAVAAAVQITVALGSTKKKAENAEQKEKRKQRAKDRKAKKAAEEKSATETGVEEEEQEEDDPETPEQALPTATRSKVHTIQRPARRSQLATREERRGTTSVLTIRARLSSPSTTHVYVCAKSAGFWGRHRDGHGCTRHASHTSGPKGQDGAKEHHISARVQGCR